MPIFPRNPGSSKVWGAAISGIHGVNSRRAQREGAPPHLGRMESLECYSCGLDELRAGKHAQAANFAGWYFLIFNDDGVIVGTADVLDGDPPQFGAVTHGGAFISTLDATLREAESIASADSNHYQLRYLQIPAMYMCAFWLHRDPGDDDWFVTVGESPSCLDARAFWAKVSTAAAMMPPGGAGLAP